MSANLISYLTEKYVIRIYTTRLVIRKTNTIFFTLLLFHQSICVRLYRTYAQNRIAREFSM